MKSIDELIALARSGGRRPLAVVAALESSVLESVHEAYVAGIAEPILIGDPDAIGAAAATAYEGRGVDLSSFRIVAAPDAAAACRTGVALVRTGEATMLMKGLVDTSVLLKAVLDKETGLNRGRLVTHVAVMEVATYHKLLFITDAAITIAPDLAAKIDIIANATALAHSLGILRPKVALLAAVEKVNAARMPCTVDAAILTQMNRRGQIPGCIVDGPLALDNAISAESARIKKIESEVAGDADILVAPDIEAGNILYKCLLDLAGAKGAGILVGPAAPVVLTSRADSAQTKLASIALASLAGVTL